ncbi:GlxA family transcriptional regulator [Chitinophaga niastensis]|nr:helix-turn-helix domain-containing protein [Chitinophaga niastensis]
MSKKCIHTVIYLPPNFYSAIASSVAETLSAINEISGRKMFSIEFVSQHANAVSRSGITFPTRKKPSEKMDLLILLAGISLDTTDIPKILTRESKFAAPLVNLAIKQGAIIAGTCGAGLLMAKLGILNNRKATIAWWAKNEAARLFPQVRWEPSRMVIKQGKIYTSGAVYAGIDLLSIILLDIGMATEERQVRKVMALPPVRQLQSPYEMPLPETEKGAFEKQLKKIPPEELNIEMIARKLCISPRTLSRKFTNEMRMSPGKWIQHRRLETARTLLEQTTLSIAEICYQVGYQDIASFSRLFSKTTGMPPGAFRKELQSN